MTPVFLALTRRGLALARTLAEAFGGECHAPPCVGDADAAFDKIGPHARALFGEGRAIVGVCAAGILVRSLAPVLSDKREEPPVIAVSEDGASVVPLLGGHRGANALARSIAGVTGGHAAVTTAGDVTPGLGLDTPPPGWRLAEPEHARPGKRALLDGASARIEGEIAWLPEGFPRAPDGGVALVATTEARAGDERTLVYHPARLVLGIGCARNAPADEVIALAQETLGQAGLSPLAVAAVVSLDLKADEAAVHAAAAHFGVPARFFDADRLEAETPRLLNPSEAVFREVGAHGVAEAAALAAVGPQGRLVAPKRKSANATAAVAEALGVLVPERIGRARGRLAILGLGPGARDWLTPEARRHLAEAETVVGYSLYLDLVADLVEGKERHSSALGEEEARVRRALALAGEGRRVALVSSGDAGVYALATLVFECLDRGDVGEGARRAEIVVAPGISAMQAAAARAGAPLGHDFCAVSLSDLLTPAEAIEARLEAAARADFALALYNPVSRRRRALLPRARAILLAHRPPDTPVVIARNLGRDGEHVRLTTLEDLSVDEVDMLTNVLVGASSTRAVKAAGRAFVYTPRGYERKRAAALAGEDAA